MHKSFNYLINIFFPPKCLLCGKILPPQEGTGAPTLICSECWQSIEFVKPPYCLKCGRPLMDGKFPICFECHNSPPAFSQMRAVAVYANGLRKCLHLFKYRNKIALAKPLAQLMIDYLSQLNWKFDLLIPVPLHPSRKRERGFNQSEVLAKRIGESLQTPVDTGTLQRLRPTRPQFDLSLVQRKENLKNAFGVTNLQPIKEKTILLIDDISTTGTTINECSRSLLKTGAKQVLALVLAHGR